MGSTGSFGSAIVPLVLSSNATASPSGLPSTMSCSFPGAFGVRSKDRLAAGADDKAPPEYKRQVDEYFKAIARKKQ